MKKIFLLIFALVLSSQNIKAQVVLDANGVTIKWTGTSVPSPYFVQASPRGTLEWFAIVSNATKGNISDYAKNISSGITYFIRPGSSTPIPLNNILTSLVTDMSNMFKEASTLNIPIGSWDVAKVTNMSYMFAYASAFNQPIGSWDVSKVTDMSFMFFQATAFNQPIGSWDVGNVINMSGMFDGALDFNQPIGSWDVGNVTNMRNMFSLATAFNQPIGSWDVSKVTFMSSMFLGAKLSTANYDSLLIGWSTITSAETPLKGGVFFDAGNSNYCNGGLARVSLVSTYGWTITDGGLDCSSLGVEELVESKLKLYPNPVESILNINIDYNLIDEPYAIFDNLGRVVLEGKFKEVESTINLKELSKGIYYLKVSNSHSSKFIKE